MAGLCEWMGRARGNEAMATRFYMAAVIYSRDVAQQSAVANRRVEVGVQTNKEKRVALQTKEVQKKVDIALQAEVKEVRKAAEAAVQAVVQVQEAEVQCEATHTRNWFSQTATTAKKKGSKNAAVQVCDDIRVTAHAGDKSKVGGRNTGWQWFSSHNRGGSQAKIDLWLDLETEKTV